MWTRWGEKVYRIVLVTMILVHSYALQCSGLEFRQPHGRSPWSRELHWHWTVWPNQVKPIFMFHATYHTEMGWSTLSPPGPHHDLPTPLFCCQEYGMLNLTIRGKQRIVAKEAWRSTACIVFKNKPKAILAKPEAHMRPEAGTSCQRRDLKHLRRKCKGWSDSLTHTLSPKQHRYSALPGTWEDPLLYKTWHILTFEKHLGTLTFLPHFY